jgi:hypothetical protein
MIRELDRKIYQVGHYISGVYENQDGLSVEKSLMQEMKVKIKGRGLMSIILRYENVSHFRFHCGRMGHAAVNCGEGGSNEQGICFSEEFRAPPPLPHVEQEKSLCSKHRRMWCANVSKLKGKGPLHHTRGREYRGETTMNDLTKGKRSVMKVQGAGTKKRQKAPNKSSTREALEGMTEEDGVGKQHTAKSEDQDSMEDDGTHDVHLPNLSSKPLMSTQDETR